MTSYYCKSYHAWLYCGEASAKFFGFRSMLKPYLGRHYLSNATCLIVKYDLTCFLRHYLSDTANCICCMIRHF